MSAEKVQLSPSLKKPIVKRPYPDRVPCGRRKEVKCTGTYITNQAWIPRAKEIEKSVKGRKMPQP